MMEDIKYILDIVLTESEKINLRVNYISISHALRVSRKTIVGVESCDWKEDKYTTYWGQMANVEEEGCLLARVPQKFWRNMKYEISTVIGAPGDPKYMYNLCAHSG